MIKGSPNHGMAVNAFAMICATISTKPEEFAETAREQMRHRAKSMTFPHLSDPSMSDMLAAELESALDRLAGMVDAQIRLIVEARRR